MIIDFHTHVFPDALAEKSIPLLAERSHLPPYADGTVAGLIASMDAAGVDKSVALSISTNAHQNKKVNDFALSLRSNSRLIPFGSVHPEADWQYELDRLADGGIVGIKLHPDYQGFFIDDPAMTPIYEAILKKGFILLFHAGLDLGLPDPMHASPARIKHVLGMFQGEKVVLAHTGGFQRWEEVTECLLGEDIYLDTSFTAQFLPPADFAALLTGHRPDKLLFATDSPWGDQTEGVALLKDTPISPELRDAIFGSNAQALLGI